MADVARWFKEKILESVVKQLLREGLTFDLNEELPIELKDGNTIRICLVGKVTMKMVEKEKEKS